MSANSIFSILFVLLTLPRARKWLLGDALALPELAYRASFIALEALKRWSIAAPLLAAVVVYAVWWDRLAWTPAPGAPAGLGSFADLRWVVGGIAIVFAWSFATYDRNIFLGRTHTLDRLLLLALSAGVLWHPLFIAPLVVQSILLARQFEHPRCLEYSFTHIRAPMDLLIIVALALPARIATGASAGIIVLLMLASLAAAYVYPAIQKTSVGPNRLWWVLHNKADRLIASSHINGWLAALRTDRVIAAVRTMATAGVLISLMTLAVEFGSGLMLLDRRLCVVLLLANVALHAVILALSGINFWKWAAADAMLAWMVLRLPEPAAAELFGPTMFAASLAMLLTAPLHFAPMRLGWADTRLNQLFRFEAVGASGTTYSVGRLFFAPYDMAFAQNRFYFLSPLAPLVMTYGTTAGIGAKGSRLIEEIERTGGDPARIDALRNHFGRAHANGPASKEFDHFVRIVLGSPSGGRSRGWWSWLAAPKHIYCSAARGAEPWRGQEPIATLRVRYAETWYDDRSIRTVRDLIVREIEVTAPVVVRTASPPVLTVVRTNQEQVAA